MEEKNEDNGERRENDRLTVQQNRSYSQRTLSNRANDNYQVSLVVYSILFLFYLFKHIFKRSIITITTIIIDVV
jgi:hypothetical protein